MSTYTVEQLMGRPLELAGNRQLFRSLRRDLDAAGRSPKTVASYHTALRNLEGWLLAQKAGGDLAAVDRDLAAAWLTWMQQPQPAGGGYAKDSVVSYFRSVRRFYNFLVADEVIEKSPLARLTQPSGSGKPLDFPSLEEIRAVLGTCKPPRGKPDFLQVRDEAIIRVFCEAGGPRCNEVASLPLEGAVELETDTLRICGKGGKWRIMALSAKTAKSLEKYMRVRSAHPFAHVPFLFIGHHGPISPSGIYQMNERRCEQAGIRRLHPHMYRHAVADRAKSAGMSEGDMMRLFGWSSTEMLHRYGAAQDDKRALAAARRLNLGNDL